MKWLDEALLKAAQRSCDKFQIYTGLTKFWLTKWACITETVFLWAIALVVLDFHPAFVSFCLFMTLMTDLVVAHEERGGGIPREGATAG